MPDLGERTLACVWYGMLITSYIDEVANDLRGMHAPRGTVQAGSIDWAELDNEVANLKSNIDRARPCGLNPDSATDTWDQRPVSVHLDELQAAVDAKDAEGAWLAIQNIDRGLQRQASSASEALSAGKGPGNPAPEA